MGDPFFLLLLLLPSAFRGFFFCLVFFFFFLKSNTGLESETPAMYGPTGSQKPKANKHKAKEEEEKEEEEEEEKKSRGNQTRNLDGRWKATTPASIGGTHTQKKDKNGGKINEASRRGGPVRLGYRSEASITKKK